MALSGSQWVSQFPTKTSIEDLSEPFRTSARRFVAALRQANAAVVIADTLRPPERAYLMHFAFAVAREALDPNAVPAMAGVDIQWCIEAVKANPTLPHLDLPQSRWSKDMASSLSLR